MHCCWMWTLRKCSDKDLAPKCSEVHLSFVGFEHRAFHAVCAVCECFCSNLDGLPRAGKYRGVPVAVKMLYHAEV